MLITCLSTIMVGEAPAADSSKQVTDAAWQNARRKALERPRRIIFNNDGNEPVYFCTNATVENLLRSRTAPLTGSQVDSIFYCTWSSGFGLFTHDTKVGQVFSTREAMFQDNKTAEFLKKGLDPLAVMVEFAHTNGIELFWSFRMNDTHDGARADYGPVMFRANRLKQEHPEWLIGSRDKPPKYGSWSAVDYGVPQIRELAFRFCEEVCSNYRVDGIELDFFRHAFLFRCSGQGEPCGEAELGALTEMVRRIRVMMDTTGRQRGRPLLLAVRVPDSIDYCKLIGIDLEKWLKEGFIDLLVVSGYTQLNPWQYSVELGRKYKVKVYPSLDEPRLRDREANVSRQTMPAYRGRALNAWAAGMDGIYLFNFFDPTSPLWRELGDPARLRTRERTYFASVRGTGSMPVPHQKFLTVTTLNPGNPLSIGAGKSARVEFRVGEPSNDRSRLRLRLEPPTELQIRLNGQELSEGRLVEQWLEFAPGPRSLRAGVNKLELTGNPTHSASLLDLEVRVMPESDNK